jgi:hypothetical protein
MKLKLFSPRAAQSGGTLVIALFISLVFGTAIVGYLTLVSTQNSLSGRSQAWNMAIGVAEAGIEEALAHLNASPAQLSKDSWYLYGGAYRMSRYMPGTRNKYTVFITNGTQPVIFCRARVYCLEGNFRYEADINRAVLVKCRQNGFAAKGMAADGQINMNGNGIMTDSFDSSDPNYSSGGHYDVNKVKDAGDVSSNGTITNTVNVGNANIFGHVATGPGGTVSLGPNGSIGSKAWLAAGGEGIQDGWVSHDSNFTFPDTDLPYTSGTTPLGGNVVTPPQAISYTTNSTVYPSPPPVTGVLSNYTKKAGTTYTYLATGWTAPGTNYYDHVLYTGDYYATDLSGTTIVLGDARLVLPNGLSMAAHDGITIAPGGQLKLYSDGDLSISGNGFFNSSGVASNLLVYCTEKVTTFDLGGNGAFCGVLVAPKADVNFHGGGNDTMDFIGAMLVHTVTLNGHFNFHYDEGLAKLASDGRFLIYSWNEVPAY